MTDDSGVTEIDLEEFKQTTRRSGRKRKPVSELVESKSKKPKVEPRKPVFFETGKTGQLNDADTVRAD